MTLAETMVAMIVSSLLLGSVLAVLAFSVRLVATAPTDTNPHTFGVLAAQVAQLEGSLAVPRSCANPAGAASRRDCLDVEADPITHQTHDGHDTCWVVDTGAGRRLECWELFAHGVAVAHRYTPDTAQLVGCAAGADTSDCLHITAWASSHAETLPRASGLAALEWHTASTPATLRSCAVIRPDERPLMADHEVPFCEDLGVAHADGSRGVLLGDGTRGVDLGNGQPAVACMDASVSQRWVCIEGYPMPALRMAA